LHICNRIFFGNPQLFKEILLLDCISVLLQSITEARNKTSCKTVQKPYWTSALMQLSARSGFGSLGLRNYFLKQSWIGIQKYYRMEQFGSGLMLFWH
jgi:hypothetical protein